MKGHIGFLAGSQGNQEWPVRKRPYGCKVGLKLNIPSVMILFASLKGDILLTNFPRM